MIDWNPEFDATQAGPVVVRGMPADIYHALPRLNAGKVAAFAKSTLAGAAEVAKDKTPTMDIYKGQVIHAKILEPAHFAASAVERDDIGPGAIVAYRKAQEQNPGAIIVAKGWLETIDAIRAAIRRMPRVDALLFQKHDAERELTIIWTERCRNTEIQCKARIDFLDLLRGSVVDLKTTNDAEIGKFERKIADLAYHIKGCWYRRAVQVAGLCEYPRLVWVVCQTTSPYTCRVYRASEAMIEQGWAQACVGVHRFIAWQAQQPDPVPEPEVMTVELPRWEQIDPSELADFTREFERSTEEAA